MKLKHALLAGVALLLAGLNSADAQGVPNTVGVPVALSQSLNQNDITNIVPHGQPGVPTYYFPTGGIGGQELYSYQIPLTAFSLTVGAGALPAHLSLLYLNPAGTLATGALTMEAAPSDGQRFCLEDTQTQTAITISAATNTSMLTSIGLGALTALVANTKYCWYYNAPLSGWIRTQ